MVLTFVLAQCFITKLLTKTILLRILKKKNGFIIANRINLIETQSACKKPIFIGLNFAGTSIYCLATLLIVNT